MRKDLKKTSRASALFHHTVIFAVQQRNLDELEQVLFDVSDPESSNYGKYWSKSEVGELTSNPTSTNAVLEYLSFKKVKVVNQSLYGEYITATATIKVWEDMFNTEFHHFDMKLQSVDGEAKIVQVIRTESYSLPVELSDHVSAVFKTVEFPIRDTFKPEPIELQQPSQSKKIKVNDIDFSQPGLLSGYVTPALLFLYYNITNQAGSGVVSQAVFETNNDAMSPIDLTYSQQVFNLSVKPISRNIGGHVDVDACTSKSAI
jgi:subtilase family serine protease